MSNGVTVQGFQMEYPYLNLRLKKEEENRFEFGLILLAMEEVSKGFKIKRINKTTKKGTKVTYEIIKDNDELEEYVKELENKARDFNNKYGKGFILPDEQTK